jgi:hypothetical protein
LLVIFVVPLAEAQDRLLTNKRGNLSIRGHVSDSTGASLPGARVVATGTGIDEVIADELGNYALAQLAEDTYVVSAEAPGFVAGVKSVRLTGSLVDTVDFKINVRSIGYGGITPVVEPTHVVRNTMNDRMALQVSLNASAEKWPLVSVIPIANGSSLFVFGPDASSPQRTSVRIVAVAGAFDLDNLSAQLAHYPGRTFIGVHRLTDSTYLLFLR